MKLIIPPIKCQGIKTKLVPLILENIKRNNEGIWIEPFLGSGVVLFNVKPKRALASDSNEHIIRFYQEIQKGQINGIVVRRYLEKMSHRLAKKNGEFYYFVRDRFNKEGSPLDLLFLSRSAFNGMMRFNPKGKFNVPFCHKPNRFSKAYITKIVNQVEAVRSAMKGKDWEFKCLDWKEALAEVKEEDFIYADPPYIGRHTDYYNKWTNDDAVGLARRLNQVLCGFALSMWFENPFRKNPFIEEHFKDAIVKKYKHFYHVGSFENYRHEMTEALVIKKGFTN